MADALQKKKLKTLQLTDWASFIEDVNFNFSVLLSSPLFVGTEGQSGSDGKQGSPGIRGSKWLFVDATKFQEQFPEDNIKGEYQITVDYLNKKLLNETSKAKLLKATNAGTLFVDCDILVANSKILLLDLTQNKFVDTGESISSNSELFLQNIEKQVMQLVNDTLAKDPVYMGLTQTVDISNAQAKNYVDNSGNINNQINENSIIDIKASNAKPGAEIDTHKMFSPAAKMFNEDDNVTWVYGSAEKYHNIVQRTLAYNAQDTTSNTTSGFGPTVKNPPAMVVLQNTQTAGLIIGHKNASKFTDFGKMYVNKDGALVICSPNVSDHYLRFSEILMYNDFIDVVSDYINFKAVTNFSGDVNILKEFNFNHRWLTINANGLIEFGSTLNALNINAVDVLFKQFPETDFLSIDKGHKLSATTYSVDRAETLDNLTKRSDKVITSNQLQLMYEYSKSNRESLNAFRTSIQEQLTSSVERLDKTDNSLQTQITNIRGGYSGSMQDIVNLISSEIAKLNISGLKGNLESEIEARKTADSNLQSQITVLKGTGSFSLGELYDKLAKELLDRAAGDKTVQETLTTLISNETTKREAAITSLKDGYTGTMKTLFNLITENAENEQIDVTALQTAITKEITDRKVDTKTISDNLVLETKTRNDNDVAIRGGYTGSMKDLATLIASLSGGTSTDVTNLLNKIDKEVTNRTNGDTSILSELTKEIANRTTADTTIRGGYTGSMQDLMALIKAMSGGSEVDLTSILEKINQEIEDRKSADVSIRGGYTNSMQSLIDSATSKVANEASLRIAGDDAVNKRLDDLLIKADAVEANTVFRPGMIVDLYVNETGSYQTIRNKLFNSSGNGKSLVSYGTPLGSVTNVDLSRFWICDGSSGTPDLRNRVTAGASDNHAIGSSIGTESITLLVTHIPKHAHTVPTHQVVTNNVKHRHISAGSTDNDGTHSHNVKYGNWKWGDNSNYRDAVNPGGNGSWSSVCENAGMHKHSFSVQSDENEHNHTFTINAIATNTQYEGSQDAISLMQPTLYCFKVMFK